MASPKNIYTSSTIWTSYVMFKNINVCTNTYMAAITIDENRSHEFEGELRGAYERVGKEKYYN